MFDPPSTPPYLAALMVSLVLVIVLLRKRPAQLSSYFLTWLIYAVPALGAAWILKIEMFDLLRMVAIGLFGGGVIMLSLCTYFSYAHFKALSYFFAILAIGIVAIGIDAFVIEPYSLEVNIHSLTSKKISKPVRIAVISDFQTDKVSDYDRQAIATLMKQKADIILWPGDFVQVNGKDDWNNRDEQIKNVNALLKELKVKAPLGVYAVRGNCEDDKWPRIFEGTGIKCFENTSTVYTNDFAITGLSFADSFTFNQKTNIPHDEKFHVVFGHGPDFAITPPDADLLVAGHTHGGQVQLPGIGPLYTLCFLPRNLAKGCCEELAKGCTLVVSRGVGMERRHAPRLRFMCKPEIVVIDIVPIH